MISPRRLGGSFLAVLPFALLASGCGLVLGLGDFTEGGGGAGGGTSSTSTSSSSATASSGQPAVCTPGTQKACLYTGTAATENIGACHAGTQVCTPEGTGYGPCAGEVLPRTTEDCSNAVDDDCNGQVNDKCPCTPGAMATCYTGPSNTEGVGICHGGMHTCNAAGDDFGPCTGEQKPLPEDCATPLDDNCDGFVCGKTTWARALTGLNVNSVGVDGGGNSYVAGSLYGPFAMGAVSLSVVGGSGTDVVVLKFDPLGNIVWGKRFGSTSNETAYAIAVDPAGNVHLTGYLGGAVDFGGGPLAAGVFVAKLDTAGNYVWAKGCGGSTASPTSLGRGIAVDPMGNVLVTGSFGGTLSCAIGQSVTSLGVADAFVLRMGVTNGGPIWTKRFGDAASSQYGYGIAAAAANGDALVTGSFLGSIDFGGGPLTAAASTSLFVAKLSAGAGAHVWSKSGGSGAAGASIAVDATDNAVFAGSYSGVTTFAGKTVAAAGGATDILFGKLDATTGNALWLNGYGNTNGDSGNSVAVSAAGRVAMGGAFRNSVDFGGGSLASGSLDAAFVATFDATPTHLWSKQFSSATLGPNATSSVAFGPAGEVVAGGQFYGTVDFGTGALAGANGTAFLVHVAP